MKNTLLLILFGLSLTSCAALFAPPPDIDRPNPDAQESPTAGGPSSYEVE